MLSPYAESWKIIEPFRGLQDSAGVRGMVGRKSLDEKVYDIT